MNINHPDKPPPRTAPGKPVLRTGPSPTTTCPWLGACSPTPGLLPGIGGFAPLEPVNVPCGPDRSDR